MLAKLLSYVDLSNWQTLPISSDKTCVFCWKSDFRYKIPLASTTNRIMKYYWAMLVTLFSFQYEIDMGHYYKVLFSNGLFTLQRFRSSGKGLKQNTLQWRHNERDGVSNQQPYECLLNCLFRDRWKKTRQLHITGLCEGNSPVTGELFAQRTSNAENVSIWWHLHDSASRH